MKEKRKATGRVVREVKAQAKCFINGSCGDGMTQYDQSAKWIDCNIWMFGYHAFPQLQGEK